ncbi:MAG: hypothetical protein R2728_08090 [Chitinophagales bacterium]
MCDTTLLPEVTNTVTATTCDPLLVGTTVDTFVAFNTCDSNCCDHYNFISL